MQEYVVIGLGRFGRSLAEELQSLGHSVVAIDIHRQEVQDVSPYVDEAIEADATSEATLQQLGVSSVAAAVVAVGSTEASILITMILKNLGVPYVIAKASNDLHGRILSRLGADRVVFPEREMAIRLARGIEVPEIVDYLSVTPEMGISKLEVPPGLIGRAMSQSQVEARFKVRVIAVIRRERVLFATSEDESFAQGDILILSGQDKDLRAIAELD
jgi:trk system potassium uptake protein TrkA